MTSGMLGMIMRISSIGYCIQQGVKNIWRQKLYSFASMATIAACIFMFGIFFCLVQNVDFIVREAENGVAVTAFFEYEMPEEEIFAIGQRISERTEVADMVYVSAEQAWEEFQKVYFKDSPELAEGFAEDNPLANCAHYEIYVSDVALQKDLVTYLKSIDGVRKVNQSEDIANMFSSFNVLVGYASVAIVILFVAVSIFLIYNTIMIGINSRKEEIGIMKLIGATNAFARTPFLIEGILIGLAGMIVPLLVLYFGYRGLTAYVVDEFKLLSGMLKFLPIKELFRTLIPASMMLSIGIGVFGSFLATRKHLRV